MVSAILGPNGLIGASMAWTSWLELAVTAVGFGLAIWQLHRTATATQATKRAIEDNTERMMLNHLLVLLPQFKSIESDLDMAAADADRSLAIRSLISFSYTANQVASLLESQGGDPEFVDELKESAKMAASAKSLLVTDARKSVAGAIKAPHEAISGIGSKAFGLAARYQVKVA